MKRRTTVFFLLFLAMVTVIVGGMMLVYDKTSVEFAYKGIKTTISGEGKTKQQPSKPTQFDTQTAVKDRGNANQPAMPSNPAPSVKISAGDQSIVLVGNNGSITVQNDHAQKH